MTVIDLYLFSLKEYRSNCIIPVAQAKTFGLVVDIYLPSISSLSAKHVGSNYIIYPQPDYFLPWLLPSGPAITSISDYYSSLLIGLPLLKCPFSKKIFSHCCQSHLLKTGVISVSQIMSPLCSNHQLMLCSSPFPPVFIFLAPSLGSCYTGSLTSSQTLSCLSTFAQAVRSLSCFYSKYPSCLTLHHLKFC